MPRRKPSAPVVSSNDILALLSAERRSQLVGEVLVPLVRRVFEEQAGEPFGALIDALTGHPHWASIRHLNVSAVMRPSAAASTAPTTPAPAKAADPAPAVVAKPAAPKATGRGGRRGKTNQALLDTVLAFIVKNPGLRSEKIQAAIVAGKGRAKAALAKLREQKRVTTEGVKRATTYTAA